MPTTTGFATDFITFSRAANATVTDSDGKVKWAPHNLLLASEQFDASNWTKSGTAVTANGVSAPNSSTTADSIKEDGAASTHYIQQLVTVPTGLVTYRVFAKLGSGTRYLQMRPAGVGTGVAYANFDLSTGAVVGGGTGGSAFVSASVSASGNGFFLCEMVANYASAPTGLQLVVSNGTGELPFYTGDNTSSIVVWGAHLYRSDLGGMQANTSAYPMYNPTTPKNLLGYSEGLSVGWTGTNGGLSGTGPELVTNGDFSSATGWLGNTGIIGSGVASFNSASTIQVYQNSKCIPGRAYIATIVVSRYVSTGSFGVRFGDTDVLLNSVITGVGTYTVRGSAASGTGFNLIGYANTNFDIESVSLTEVLFYEAPNGLQTARAIEATSANGTLLGSISLLASPYTFSIWLKRKTGSGNVQLTVDGTTYATVAVTDTWARFSTTLTPTAGSKTPGIRLASSGDAVYAWGAQLSDSASLDTYVPSYGAAPSAAAYYGPRRDFDPVTLACKGLLVEEQRTNLALNSNAVGTSTYLATITPNAAVSPTGETNAGSMSTTNIAGRVYFAAAVVTSTVYAFSVYAKAGTNTEVYLERAASAGDGKVIFNLSNGTVTSGTGGTITPAQNGYYRCSMVFTATGSGSGEFRVGTNDATSKTIFVFGAQLEAGSFATSYIPTGAATATRNGDVASVSTQAFPYSATEGTLVVSALRSELVSLDGATATLFTSLSDVIEMYVNGANNRLYGAAGGVSDVSLLDSGKISAGNVFKSGTAFKQNDYALVTNGGTALTDTTATVPPVTTLGIGSRNGSVPFRGWIRQITYLPRRISNAELQSRTA